MIKAQDIEKLFGDFLSEIKDAALREKVVATWVEGCRQGGWKSVDDLQKMPFTLATDPRGLNFIEHTRAVTAGALGLANAQKENYAKAPYTVNLDYLTAGGLLHDVGKLLEIEPDGSGGWRKSHAGRCARHPVSGAVLAAAAGLPQEVINIIVCHAKEGEGRPQRPEAVLVHQADFATFNPLVMLEKGNLITEG